MKNISKRVISLGECKDCGYVINICLDEHFDICGYYVADDESEEILFLPLEKIVKNSDAIMVQSEQDLQYVEAEKDGLLGCEIYDAVGKYYGVIVGLDFCKNRLEKVVTDKGEILRKYLKIWNGRVILCDFHRKKSPKRYKVFETKEDIVVNVLSEQKGRIKEPDKVSLSYKFYIGKCAREDMFGYNNERLVRHGEKITKTIFENVKKHNKLNELFFILQNR